jgi:hypothetical protein
LPCLARAKHRGLIIFWPDVGSRPFCFCRHARARSARTGNAVTVRAARGAQRRGACSTGHHFFGRARWNFDGLDCLRPSK